MSKDIKLNLKEFKHVSSDDKSTTLQHKQGHQLTLAHSALSKNAQEQLKALAHASPAPKAADKAQAPNSTHEKRKMMADGGDPGMEMPPMAGQAPMDPRIAAAMQNGIQIDQTGLPQAAPPQPEAQLDPYTGAMRVPYQAPPAERAIPVGEVAQKGMMGAIMHPEAEVKPQELPGGAAAEAQAQQTQQPKTEVVAPTPVANPTDPASLFASGYQDKLKGFQVEAGAKMQAADEMAKIRQHQMEVQQAAQDSFKQSYSALEKERQDMIQDVKAGYIDPEKYWTGDKDGNGSHSKIASAIGMIVAGFNPAGTPNAAVDFLKSQMERNIQAQQKNLDSKNNLLSANLKQFGNLHDATQMTRLMQTDMMTNQLEMAAAKAANPMAKAQLLQAAGHLKMESAPAFQQFAMRRAVMNMNNSEGPVSEQALDSMIGQLRMLNPEMAKEMQTRRVPGFGMATIPVPDGVRKEIIEKKTLNDAANDLMAYSKKSSNLVPGTKEYNYGVAKALALQQKIREGLLGTVFRESEKPLLEKFVDDNPAGMMKAISTQPKIRAILDSNNMALKDTLNSYGLKVPQQMQQPAQKPEIAIGDVVMGKDGRQYKRVGDKMVPVKK